MDQQPTDPRPPDDLSGKPPSDESGKDKTLGRKHSPVRIAERITGVVGTILAIYALIATWLARRDLPEGVCPIDDNRPLMILAAVLLVTSLVLSMMRPKKA